MKRINKSVEKRFWKSGEIRSFDGSLILRKPGEADREQFLVLEEENALFPELFTMQSFKNYLWKAYNRKTMLMCSVVKDGAYIGHCGIVNGPNGGWEIAIELLNQWKDQGFGYRAISLLLDAVKERMGISEFTIRIETDNIASERLFEKLGAVKTGTMEYLVSYDGQQDEIHKMRLYYFEYRLIWKN